MFPHTITLKKVASVDKYNEKTFTTTNYKGRFYSYIRRSYDGSIVTAEQDQRVVFLEPDADPTVNDEIAYGGETYAIVRVEKQPDFRGNTFSWQIVVR